MITVVILNVLAVFFAYLESKKILKHGLKISFFLIFLFLSLRYDYGNDYFSYLSHFNEVNSYDYFDYFADSHYEIAWSLICRLFYPFGFFAMVAFIASVNCYVFYSFFKQYVPSNYYWFAVLFYVFTPDLMLVQLSSMRQTLAIIIFIYSINYIYRNNLLRYHFSICIASFFHTSALILFPIFYLKFFKKKYYKKLTMIIFIIFISMLLFGQFLKPYIFNFLSNSFDRYSEYADEGVLNTGLGLMFNIIMFVSVLYFYKFQNGSNELLFKIATIAFFTIPLGLVVLIGSRLGFYFLPVMAVVYSLIASNIRRFEFRVIFLSSIIFITMYQFYYFFQSDIWAPYYGTYKTIFSSPFIY